MDDYKTPVSIVPWYDAKKNPPTGETRLVLFRFNRGHPEPDVMTMRSYKVGEVAWDGDLWAELPVVGDLTVREVRAAVVSLQRTWHAGSDRLRAALEGRDA